MPRCPQCDSPDVYRHTSWPLRRRFICRHCLADLELSAGSLFLSRGIVVGVWMAGVAVLATVTNDTLAVLLTGLAVLALVLLSMESVLGDLQVLPKPSSALPSTDASGARRVWFGIRRRDKIARS